MTTPTPHYHRLSYLSRFNLFPLKKNFDKNIYFNEFFLEKKDWLFFTCCDTFDCCPNGDCWMGNPSNPGSLEGVRPKNLTN